MLCGILGHKLAPVTPITSEEDSSLICLRCLQLVVMPPERSAGRPKLTVVRSDSR